MKKINIIKKLPNVIVYKHIIPPMTDKACTLKTKQLKTVSIKIYLIEGSLAANNFSIEPIFYERDTNHKAVNRAFQQDLPQGTTYVVNTL